MIVNPNTAFLYLKIYGRNLTTPGLSNTAKCFGIREGAVFTKNFNEELDSATIVLPQCSEEIEIEPYDAVEIGGTKINKIYIKAI